MAKNVRHRRNYSEGEPDLESEFPALSKIGAYFHQSWDFGVYDDPWEMVELFVHNRFGTVALPLEIADLLATRDEAGVYEVLASFDNNYDYTDDGLTGREFLERVAERAAANAPTPDPMLSPLIGRRITAAQTTWPYWVQAEGLTIHLLTGSVGDGPRTAGVAEKPGHLAPWLEEAVGERILHATDTNGQFHLATRHTRFASLRRTRTPSYLIG